VFAKVFSQILDSSIAAKPTLRHAFMDFLLLADADGVVDMTVEAIARRTGLPADDWERWIVELEAPDVDSRNPENEGRRIVRLDEHRRWGWQIVNYGHYRATASEEQRKASQRSRWHRWKDKQASPSLTPANAPLTPANASNAMQRQMQMQKQMERESTADPAAQAPPPLAVELPFGFPKTEADAEVDADFICCPKEFAKTVWQKAHSRLGRDSRDVPIRVWRSYLAAEWAYEKSRQGERRQQQASAAAAPGGLNAGERFQHSKELEKIEAALENLNSKLTGMNQLDDIERIEKRQLSERRAFLLNKLGRTR